MTTFKPGDNVLVTLGGMDVPAIVSYVWSDSIHFRTIDVDDDISVPVGVVRLDPSKKNWAVGDVINDSMELMTLLYNTVFVDVNDTVQEWDEETVWAFGCHDEVSPDSVDYPVIIIHIPKDV